MIAPKKIFILFLAALFLFISCPVYSAYTNTSELLFNYGVSLYRQGKYNEALGQFKKALLAEPNYEPALKYIEKIQGMKGKAAVASSAAKASAPVVPRSSKGIDLNQTVELMEIQKEMMQNRNAIASRTVSPEAYSGNLPASASVKKQQEAPEFLVLDESFKNVPQPISLEQGKSVLVSGKNINKFLLTQEGIVDVSKENSDTLLVTGKGIGYAYLHVWDDSGRNTIEWLGTFPKWENTAEAEKFRIAEKKEGNFKLRYALDWNSYETGHGVRALRRNSYAWSHDLALNGPTPYGDLDSKMTFRRLNTSSDLTYFTVGLINGRYGSFKDFGIRLFDFYPLFSNLTFPGETLRGAMVSSPAFNKKLDYTVFWGREGGGRYGNLSPGLNKTKNSFLEGFNLNLSPSQKQNYRFSLLHGWGRDRESGTSDYAYDMIGVWNFKEAGFGYEIANDTETFAHILNARLIKPNFSATVELRDINKNFFSMTGRGWRAGERGGLFNFNFLPIKKLRVRSALNIYQDRLFPAEDNLDRWNEDFDLSLFYELDPDSSLNMAYTIDNDLGKLSQVRYQNASLGYYRTFRLLKPVSTFLTYYHQDNQNYSSPAVDFINERLFGGFRIGLIGQLYYYANAEVNYMQERFNSNMSRPRAYETGIDWSDKIGSSPFEGTFRVYFHKEEHTGSPLSFLTGEDFLEGFSEFKYKPDETKEVYTNVRMRNTWANSETVQKKIDFYFNAGVRYVWDTGVKWESVGNIEGYVFQDLNSDGLRQRDEAPVEGVKVWLGQDRNQATDLFGYYRFKGVRAKKAYVNIDITSLPGEFVLTVPATQEVFIQHHRTSRVDFGIISRTEISGLVYEDVDGDGEFDLKDKGVSGIEVTLDDKKTVETDSTGKYIFTNVKKGDHVVTLNLKSLPIYYLPEVAITKEIPSFEGATYFYNIPLKRVKQ